MNLLRRPAVAGPVLLAAGLALMSVGGCSPSTPTAAPTVTKTVTAAPSIVVFDPTTSGKALAARIAARAKADTPSDKVLGVTCANFPNLQAGTHTDCHMTVNGAKVAVRATFSGTNGHYVLTRIKS